MRGLRGKRARIMVVGLLGLALVALVAIALTSEEGWATQLLQGAAVMVEGEPSVFPATNLVTNPSVPRGQGLAGGQSDTPVVLNGLREGGCEVWGTDEAHPEGIAYTAGTFDLVVDGVNVPAYSIDTARVMNSGDAYQANLYATTEANLCPALWIVNTYRPEAPGAGLTAAEEGAAIQAAVWHYAAGFEPVWRAESWCTRPEVHQRAIEMIESAAGQCLPLPATLDVAAEPEQLPPGSRAAVWATLHDQQGQPLAETNVIWTATLGELDRSSAATDGEGRAPASIVLNDRGTAVVTANLLGESQVAAVDPVGQPFQRLLARVQVRYTLENQARIEWQGSRAISLISFEAAWLPAGDTRGTGIVLTWHTSSETGNAGFNLYRANSPQGPWTPLNQSLIGSAVPAGSGGGGNYEWLDRAPQPGTAYCYLLEDVDAAGTITPHEVVCP